jgi:hypothetical protein
MRFRLLCLATLGGLILTACGVEGPPVAPEPRPEAGIGLSGSVELGVSGSR